MDAISKSVYNAALLEVEIQSDTAMLVTKPFVLTLRDYRKDLIHRVARVYLILYYWEK